MNQSGTSAAALAGFGAAGLAFGLLTIVMVWRVFSKGGQPGWASLIPFYNTYVMLKLVGRPGWWLLLFFVPLVNFVIGIVVMIDLAKSFGKSAVFGFFGLVVFSIIGLGILAFGSSQYQGPAALGHRAQPYPM
jgi:hypothetical protein